MHRAKRPRSNLLPRLGLVAALITGCSFDGTGINWADDAGVNIDANTTDGSPFVDASFDAPTSDADTTDAPLPADAAPDAEPADAAPPDADVPDPILEDVVHVPDDGEFSGVGEIVLAADVTVDTSALTIDGETIAGKVILDTWPQDPSGPGLAILHVRSLTISAGVTVTVTGDRPLVIIASRDVNILGTVDASANLASPGPNGRAAAQGTGAGGDGEHVPEFFDSGGGGAGHGTAGAAGGASICNPSCDDALAGTAGPGYNTLLTVLAGGSGGGSGGGTDCEYGVGGAGGGAIQIYAGSQITISGAITVGGGGGGAGTKCGGSAGAGGGGGSGGGIYLQAPEITHSGTLAGNGGGGGGGASGSGTDGSPGEDGLTGVTAAAGGDDGGNTGEPGGDGGALGAAPTAGTNSFNQGNGGGGGAAVGRIVVIVNTGNTFASTGQISPAAATGTY